MSRFEESSGPTGVDRERALELRLAEVQEQLRATSDILKVLTSSSSDQTARLRCRRRQRPSAPRRAGGADLPRRGRVPTCWPGRAGSRTSSSTSSRDTRSRATGPRWSGASPSTGRCIGSATSSPTRSTGAATSSGSGGYRSMMGAPMVVGDQVVGALNVWRTTVDPFDDASEALLATFAEQAALALRHVQLVTALESRSAELARKVDQLEALAEVGEAISSTLVADEVLTTIVTHAVRALGHRRRFADGVRRGDRSLRGPGGLRHEPRRHRGSACHRDPPRPHLGGSGRARPGRCCRSRTSTPRTDRSTRTSPCCTPTGGARSSRSRSCGPTGWSGRSSCGASRSGRSATRRASCSRPSRASRQSP